MRRQRALSLGAACLPLLLLGCVSAAPKKRSSIEVTAEALDGQGRAAATSIGAGTAG
jgi:hypothetical protein